MNTLQPGQYIPLDSFIHKLDPRTKIIITLILMSAIFLSNQVLSLVILASIVFAGLFASKISIFNYFQEIKIFIYIIFIIIIFQFLFAPGNNIFSLKININEVYSTALLAIKILLLVLIAQALSMTTSVTGLRDALEVLLKPLTTLKFPIHELLMIITIALSFIPIFIQEARNIKLAQEARGASLKNSSMALKIRIIYSFLVPLFVITIKRAFYLAEAMESRAYSAGAERGKMNELSFKISDKLLLFTSIILLIVIIIYNFRVK